MAKRTRKMKTVAPQAKMKVTAQAPGISLGSNDAPGAHPSGLGPEELEYRTMLQEAILWVSKEVLEEQREDILKRAMVRVKTLQELRG